MLHDLVDGVMAHIRSTAFGAVFLALVAAQPAMAQEQECENLSPDMLETHRSLYEYALIAEYAYERKAPSHSCTVGAPDESLDPDESLELSWEQMQVQIQSPPSRRWRSILVDDREVTLEWYKDEDDIFYVACRREGATSLGYNVAISWVPVVMGDTIRSIVWGGIILLENFVNLVDERVGFIELDRVDGNGKVIAFRGTDLTELRGGMKDLSASVGDLLYLDGSCAFELATQVVASVIGGSLAENHFSVIGHSLGGAATQHVALDQAENKDKYSRSVHGEQRRELVEFKSYSFNSVGLDVPISHPTSLPRFYSYSIDEEFVSVLGNRLGRIQAGNAIRYIPPDTKEWSERGAIKRHRITTVQKGLCDCLNKQGKIEEDR